MKHRRTLNRVILKCHETLWRTLNSPQTKKTKHIARNAKNIFMPSFKDKYYNKIILFYMTFALIHIHTNITNSKVSLSVCLWRNHRQTTDPIVNKYYFLNIYYFFYHFFFVFPGILVCYKRPPKLDVLNAYFMYAGSTLWYT